MGLVITTTYEAEYTVAQGVPCVRIRQPLTEWWYTIRLKNIDLAANEGCGIHRPGALVCGYLPGEAHGWVVGYFPREELQRLYDESPLWCVDP